MFSFFVNDINKPITDNLFHHIANVIRKKEGDFFILYDNVNSYKVKITDVLSSSINFEIVEKYDKISKKTNITLIQGYPKGQKPEFICKYATMFGVDNIIFTYMKRSIPTINNPGSKLQRYKNIIVEASNLSKRVDIPNIEIVNSISDIDFSIFDDIFLAYEDEDNNRIDISKCINKNIAVIVGPEGGIDKKEIEYLKTKKTNIITLGKNILSTEAAILAFLSLFL
ncbi:MAG: 16S rRNA (uracil(1498)-N(3))-methyltransferase [Acholeplasmatales bacterium]|jgi:16S rRNA (uracil1498-N3)-methyltransferase|nr:16S rRNA (uracil(1498)-N(3))-methyltransferase [Acholeplasmatales bacterium]